MNTRQLATFGVASLVAATGIMVSQTASAATLTLHNDDAEVGEDCPDAGGAYWHFIIAPNNNRSSFNEIYLNIDGVVQALNFESNGTQDDNVFVAVPVGASLEDLEAEGSYADISGPGRMFVLSHVCPGEPTDPS